MSVDFSVTCESNSTLPRINIDAFKSGGTNDLKCMTDTDRTKLKNVAFNSSCHLKLIIQKPESPIWKNGIETGKIN